MKEFSATTSITSSESSGASRRGDMSAAGDVEFPSAMKTAARDTVAESSAAPATLPAAEAASAASAQPVAVSAHSAASATRVAPAGSRSGSPEGDQRKHSPGPAYFSVAYYKQLLLSFSSARWFCPPPELSPFLLARNGFRCTDTGTIECAVCGEKWTAQRGPHSEIMRTPAHTDETSAAGNAAALSSPPPRTLSTPPVYSFAVAAAKTSAFEPRRRATGREQGTAFETHTAAVHASSLPAAVSAATAGAAGAAVATVGEEAETAARRNFKGQEKQHQREEEIKQRRMGRHVVEGVLQQRKQTTEVIGTTRARSRDSGEKRERTTAGQLLREGKEVEKDSRRGQKGALMDAVTLSFLHAECCPWRNSFIPLATIHLEGTAVQPAALISQWTNRVQQLRKAGVSLSQPARPPRLALQSARAFLLSVLVAAAEATATTYAKATSPPKVTAAEGQVAAEDITSRATPALHASETSESGASSAQVSKASGVMKELGAAETLKETSCCNGESRIAQFLSSAHSPLQAACVSQLSKREVELLRQLWLFLARADREREILVNKYIPHGTVIPPVCASTLLLERKCELREGSQRYKETDEFLSLPILETLLQQVVSFLFDTRVPVPGSVRRSTLLTNENPSDDEVSSPCFVFPKKHESVHIDCDKLFAFFGWEPVTHCMTSEREHHTAAAVPDQHEHQPRADTAPGESNLPYAFAQQRVRHGLQRLDATQHAEVFSEHKGRQGDQRQLVQVTRPNKVGDALRDKERKLAAASVAEVTVEGRESATALQCPYCFRRVQLQKYVSSEEEGCVISDSTWNLSFSEEAARSQNGDETGVALLSVEGRQQPIQQRGDYGAQTAEGKKKSNGAETGGEQKARSSTKDSKEQRQESTREEMEKTCFSENIVRGTGRTAAAIYGDGGVDQSRSNARRNRCISRTADAEVRVRRDGDGEPPKEAASVGGVYAPPQRTQGDHISSTTGSKSMREEELETTNSTVLALSFDPVCAHRLHCPFVSNVIYKDKSPLVLKLFLSLFPVLVETSQLQTEKRRLDAEINELWGSSKRLQRSKRSSDDEKEF